MSRIGDLTVRIGADISDLRRGLDGATGRVQGFRRSIEPMVKTMAAVGAAATAAAVGVAAFTKSGMNAIDAQAKLARQLDSTIGGLRGLQLASEDAGVATGVINSAMERFSARLGEAQRDTGQAKDALDRLGLSASNLASMDVDERMAVIADRVQQLGLSGAETADVLRQFGIRNREIVNLLRQGGDAIRNARQEIEDYGLAVDAVDAGAIEAANDALSRVGLVTESVRNALAVELAPVVLEIATRFNDAAREAGGMGDYISNAVQMSVQAIAGLLDKLQQIRIFNQQVVVATRDMELAFARFAKGTWDTVSPLFDNMTRQINFILNGLSKIPGMGDIGQMELFSEGDFMERINNRLEQALGSRNLAQMDLNELVNADLPSEQIDEFFDRINDRREELKASIDEDDGFVPSMLPGGEGEEGGESGSGAQGSGIEGYGEQLQKRLDLLRDSMETEREIELERYQTANEDLREALELEMLTEEEYNELKRENHKAHVDKITAMDEQAAKQRERLQQQVAQQEIRMRQDVVNQAAGLLQSLGRDNKAFALASIALTKGMAIAQTIAHTQTASMLAYASQLIPGDPSSVARAASAALATQKMGAVKVGLIAAQGLAEAGGVMSSGGGGVSASGSGGSSGGNAAQQPAQPAAPSGGTLTVEGISSSSLFTGDAVRELAEELISYQKRGGVVVLE